MRTTVRPHSAMGIQIKGSKIRVAGAQHGGETGRLHLATAAFARLFKVPVIADDLERPFAVNFFLQSPQGLLDWLAFFQFNFCQSIHILPGTLAAARRCAPILFSQAEEGIFCGAGCQWPKSAKKDAWAQLDAHARLPGSGGAYKTYVVSQLKG